MGGIMVPLTLFPLALVNFKSSTFVHKVLQTSCDIVITFSIVCCCLFFVEFLDHPAQNMYQNSTPWKALWNYLLNEWSLIPNGLRMKKLWSFYSGTTLCPETFQNSRFLMRWKVDLMDLQNNLLFSHGTSLILDKKTHYNSNTLEMMMIRSHDFLRGHASYLLLEQTIFFQNH